MKTILNPKRSTAGGAILYTIIVTGIAAITMACYLRLVQNEFVTVARSQTWNNALVMAESGIEEGLALINKYEQTTNVLTDWTKTAASQDHWTALSANVFTVTRTNDNYGYYTVYVTNIYDSVNSNYTPAILSIGTVFWQGSDMSFGGSATRKVLVQTSGDASASGGMTAQYTIDFNGNNVTVDSYNSADPTASLWHTNWFYMGHNFGTYSSAYRTANVVVGTDGQLLNAGNGNVYGYVNTGPGGTVSINNNGTVGDLNWIGPDPSHPYNNGIQKGHQRDDMNISFPDVVAPSPGSWRSVPLPSDPFIVIGGVTNYYTQVKGKWGYTIGGNQYSLIITNIAGNPGTPTNKIYYEYSSTLNQSLFIDASNVVLYLPSGANLGSGDNLTLNTNANVEIYSGSAFSTKNGLVNNLYQYAVALSLNGTTNCTSIDFGGNANLTVNLYAPEAEVDFNGSGSSTYDVCGSMKVKQIKVNGHYNFHFDEVLKEITPPTRYLPTVWQEVY